MESHTKKMAADSCLGGQSYSTANEVHHFSIQSELTVAILGTSHETRCYRQNLTKWIV